MAAVGLNSDRSILDSVARLISVRSASASSDHPRSARNRASRCAIRRSISGPAAAGRSVEAVAISIERDYLELEMNSTIVLE
jgi:hypothetical protein